MRAKSRRTAESTGFRLFAWAAFLNSLWRSVRRSVTCPVLLFGWFTRVCQHPASRVDLSRLNQLHCGLLDQIACGHGKVVNYAVCSSKQACVAVTCGEVILYYEVGALKRSFSFWYWRHEPNWNESLNPGDLNLQIIGTDCNLNNITLSSNRKRFLLPLSSCTGPMIPLLEDFCDVFPKKWGTKTQTHKTGAPSLIRGLIERRGISVKDGPFLL